jgi:hypothetical protein
MMERDADVLPGCVAGAGRADSSRAGYIQATPPLPTTSRYLHARPNQSSADSSWHGKRSLGKIGCFALKTCPKATFVAFSPQNQQFRSRYFDCIAGALE